VEPDQHPFRDLIEAVGGEPRYTVERQVVYLSPTDAHRYAVLYIVWDQKQRCFQGEGFETREQAELVAARLNRRQVHPATAGTRATRSGG